MKGNPTTTVIPRVDESKVTPEELSEPAPQILKSQAFLRALSSAPRGNLMVSYVVVRFFAAGSLIWGQVPF